MGEIVFYLIIAITALGGLIVGFPLLLIAGALIYEFWFYIIPLILFIIGASSKGFGAGILALCFGVGLNVVILMIKKIVNLIHPKSE